MSSSTATTAGRTRTIQTSLGQWQISEKQSQKLGLKKNSRLSPQLEANCLLLSANVSYASAARDLQKLTGIYVDHSTQQRLVHRQEFPDFLAKESVIDLSVDGGKARLRTAEGEASEWRDYKAVMLHDRGCAACFQENQQLLDWVNHQPLSNPVTCLGDGHPGVWNLIADIATPQQRREILDWYHLNENLYKVGGSNQRLRTVESLLWRGKVDEAIAAFADWDSPQVKNFLAYLEKHRLRIPDYQDFRSQGITIGSGAVESKIKQIGRRIKISGAQWNRSNLPQVLKHRCAYLNLDCA